MGNWKIIKMKNILRLLVLMSFGSYAQKIRPFVGVSGYIHTAFDNSGFGDLKLGAEYKVFYYLKPEIEAELKRFDQSLSPFNDSSVISRVNRNEELVTDSFLFPYGRAVVQLRLPNTLWPRHYNLT